MSVNGTNGSAPGGAGGGASSASGATAGNGANGQVTLTYSNATPAVQLSVNGTGSTVADQFGNTIAAGTQVLDGSTVLATFSAGNSRFPSNVANQVAIDTAGDLLLQNSSKWVTLFGSGLGNANITVGNGNGITGQIPSVQSDTSTNTDSTSGVVAITKAWAIPANDAQTGTIYRIRTRGHVTWSSSFSATPYCIFNGVNTAVFANTGTYSTGFITTTHVAVWECELWIQVITTGSGGTVRIGGWQGWEDATAHSSAGIWPFDAGGASPGATTAFNTTAATTMAFGWGWSGAGAPTMSCTGSIFYREGP